MTDIIENILKPISGYLIFIARDTMKGNYNLQIGIPNSWVFDSNDNIECEVIEELPNGKRINVKPKKENVNIDDLVSFVVIIVEINERIANKEKEFSEKMDEMKSHFEDEYKNFYKELDELKENSFQTANNKFVNVNNSSSRFL